MDVKKFLKQYSEIDRRIASRCRRILELKDRAVSVTKAFGERVQGGGDVDSRAQLIERYIDMQYELELDILEFTKVQAKIKLAIGKIENPLWRDVLERYYLEGMTLEGVAEDLEYSYMQISRIHKLALEDIDVIVC